MRASSFRMACIAPASVFVILCLSSCSMSLRRCAVVAGAPHEVENASFIEGTFQNVSASRFGPAHPKLWDLLAGGKKSIYGLRTGAASSGDSDRVRLALEGSSSLKASLIANGSVKQTVTLPFRLRTNYVSIFSESDVRIRPWGYRIGLAETALTARPEGDLILMQRFHSSGALLFVLGAGDGGTVDISFPRLTSTGEYTEESRNMEEHRKWLRLNRPRDHHCCSEGKPAACTTFSAAAR